MSDEDGEIEKIAIEAIKLIADLSLKLSPDDVGACVVNLPTGAKCFMITPDQCTQLGGNFIGGTCT